MNIALWVVQGLMAVVFLMAGGMKVSQPKEKLLENMGVLENMAPSTIKLIGTLEVLGAIGLALPFLTGILPILTPIAAVSLVLTMIVAAVLHSWRSEYPNVGANVVLGLLAAFVAYGRFVA